MLSLSELRRAVRTLEELLLGAILERVVQPHGCRLVLTFHQPDPMRERAGSYPVLLSCEPDRARLSLLSSTPKVLTAEPPFAQYLRAHLRRARFDGARIVDEDRQAALLLKTREGDFSLLLSILGARSNIYLLDGENRLLFSLRSLEETRKELARGKPWVSPKLGSPPDGTERWTEASDQDYLHAIERTYERLEREHQAWQISRKIERSLSREAAGNERKIAGLERDLESAIEAPLNLHYGEMLKGVLQRIMPGDRAVTATDFETGEQLEIPIDPRLSAAENLELYFKRYHKERRGVGMIERQLSLAREDRARIEALHEQLHSITADGAGGLDALVALDSQPEIRRLAARHYPTSRAAAGPRMRLEGGKTVPARLLPRRYKSADCLEIWVGRSDRGNDYMTTRLARGNDLFFHLRGSSGSHVILRTEGRQDPPSESLLDACELAVHFSKQGRSSRADVHIAPIKYVKKPAGSKPGLVYVRQGKTIHLRRAPKRLARLLASRIED